MVGGAARAIQLEHDQGAVVVVHAALDLHDVLVEGIPGLEINRASGGEVARLCFIRPLVDREALDSFGYEEMQVCITLPVGMRNHIDRHPVGTQGEVGAMVDVKSAQKDLLCLAAARMLCDEDARHSTQEFL